MPKLGCCSQIIDELIGVFKESLALKRSHKLTAKKEGILFDIKYSATSSSGVACDDEPSLTKLFKDRYSKDKVISQGLAHTFMAELQLMASQQIIAHTRLN